MRDRMLVAGQKGLLLVERKGGERSSYVSNAEFVGDNVSIVLTDLRNGTCYATLDHGHFGAKLHCAENGGDWEECAAPAYPPKPEGEKCTDQWGKVSPWSAVCLWALEAGAADQPGVLWCGTLPAGLFRSDDGGSSWQLLRSLSDHPERKEWFGGGASLPALHSICVEPHDSNCLRVAVSCGRVWHSNDGGETWNCHPDGRCAAYMPREDGNNPNIQCPHRLVQCRDAPNALWVQNQDGIFHSTDGSRLWKEIEDAGQSNFGFTTAVHPSEAGTARFVPGIKDKLLIPVDGRLVVTRTQDGGKTFDLLHAAPSAVCIRHRISSCARY